MGGSNIVIIESALQDLMWNLVRTRAAPAIVAQVRQRLQRLMSDVSLCEQLRAREAEETPDHFCNSIVYDIVDNVCHEQIPFVEVALAKSALERVAATNEALKLQIQEKEELERLRELALARKSDALVYTSHRYFEEVFMLRRERQKLVSLLRASQKKMNELTGNSTTTTASKQQQQQQQQNQHDSIPDPLSTTLGPGFLGAVLDRVGGTSKQQQQQQQQVDQSTALDFTLNSTVNLMALLERTLCGASTNKQQQQQQRPSATIAKSALDHLREEQQSPSNDTMAIFSYDELAVRLLLQDPDLAQLKMQNVKLCRDLEQQRIDAAVQKRRMTEEFQNKIRGLELRLKVALGDENGGDSGISGTVTLVRAAKELLVPLRASVKGIAESFKRDRDQVKKALSDFASAFATMKTAVSDDAMRQMECNEQQTLKQVELASEYINTLCSGAEDDVEMEETEAEKQEQMQEQQQLDSSSAAVNTKDPATIIAATATTTTTTTTPEEPKKMVKISAREAARRRYESCLDPSPSVDELDTIFVRRAKRYLLQHELTAHLRSTITVVSQSTSQFGDLLQRLSVLSAYAGKERAEQARIELQEQYQFERRRRQQERDDERGICEKNNSSANDDDANQTLVALSVAARVTSSPRMYRRLLRAAKVEEAEDEERRRNADGSAGVDDGDETSGVMTREDRKRILDCDAVLSRHIRNHIVSQRFANIAERLRRRRMLAFYDSFREFVGRSAQAVAAPAPAAGDDDEGGGSKEAGENQPQGPMFPHNWTPTGPFANMEAFESWRSRLLRVGQLSNEQHGLLLDEARSSAQLIVTELVTSLPAGLLALLVSRSKRQGAGAGGSTVWSDPFCDFDEEPSPYDADLSQFEFGRSTSSVLSTQHGGSSKSLGTARNNSTMSELGSNKTAQQQTTAERKRSAAEAGRARAVKQQEEVLKRVITCPHCGELLNGAGVAVSGGVGGEADASASDALSPTPSRLLTRISQRQRSATGTPGETALLVGARRTKQSTATPPVNVDGTPLHADNNNSSNNNNNSNNNDPSSPSSSQFQRRHRRRSSLLVAAAAAREKKSVLFSPDLHTVVPDEVIPASVAAAPSRHGYFMPTPPSNRLGSASRRAAAGGSTEVDSVSVASGIVPAGGASSETAPALTTANLLMQTIRSGSAPSILRGGAIWQQQQQQLQEQRFLQQQQLLQQQQQQLQQDEHSSSTTLLNALTSSTSSVTTVPPPIVAFGSSTVATSIQQQQQQRQQLAASGGRPGMHRPPSAEQALLRSLFSTQQQQQQLDQTSCVSVSACLQSVDSQIPREEEMQASNGGDDAQERNMMIDDGKLLLIRRLRGHSSPAPAIISTVVGLSGCVEVAKKSMDLSVRVAAKRFVGRTLIDAAAHSAFGFGQSQQQQQAQQQQQHQTSTSPAPKPPMTVLEQLQQQQ